MYKSLCSYTLSFVLAKCLVVGWLYRTIDSYMFPPKKLLWDFLVDQWLRLCSPNAEGWDLTPSQETRSRMLQLRAHMLQLRSSVP